MYSGINS